MFRMFSDNMTKKNMEMNTHCCGFRHDVDGASLLTEWVGGKKCTIERDKAALLTFLTRSKWTSPGGSGRTLLFRHPITSPWAAAQSATVATRSPASSPPRPIQHSQGIQRPGCTHTRSKRSWMKDDPTPQQLWWPSVSTYTSQNTANTFKRSTSSRIYSRQVTLTVSVPLGKNLFLKVSSFDRKGCQTHSQAAQEGSPGESTGAPSKMTSYVEKRGGENYSNEWSRVDCTSFCRVGIKRRFRTSPRFTEEPFSVGRGPAAR